MENRIRKAQILRSVRSRYSLQGLRPGRIWRHGSAAKGEPRIVSVPVPLFIAEALI